MRLLLLTLASNLVSKLATRNLWFLLNEIVPNRVNIEVKKVLIEMFEMALTEEQESRVIEMAWEDRTPFEAIERLFGLPEKDVIKLMRKNLKQKTFKNWRERVSGRKTKHASLRPEGVDRGYCPSQYKYKGANK